MEYGLGKLTRKKIEVLNKLRKRKKEDSNYKIIDIGGGKEKHCSDKFDFIDAYSDFRVVKSNNENLKHFNGNINDLELWEQILKDVETNGKYDFCICTHLLEDIAFPSFVCQMINKVALSGLITFPSKYKELSYFESNTYRGYSHHRWIMTIKNSTILGFPKQGFIENLNWKEITNKLSNDNEELWVLWSEKIKFNIINDDWLGPSPTEIVQIYKTELHATDEDLCLK